MSALTDEIIAATRGWIGTRYRHQASCMGVGCDCLGLIRGVWKEIYGAPISDIPPYTQFEKGVSGAAQHSKCRTKILAPRGGSAVGWASVVVPVAP